MQRRRRLAQAVMLSGGLLVCATAPVRAEEKIVCPICLHADDEHADYHAKAGMTFVRGASNLLFGWTEVIREPAQEAREGRNVRNVVVGMANGVGHGITRTAMGVGELLTFWTPKINNRYVHLAADCPICMGKKKVLPPSSSPPASISP